MYLGLMAYPVCISVPENTVPPTDGEVYIKHVEFNGKDENDFCFEYRRLEKTLLFEFLSRLEDSPFPENLMAVSFNTRMVQNENNNFCSSVLKGSIFCEGQNYRFLGHSDSQLREKMCYLMRASEGEIHDLLARFGDFAKITDVGRRASRIGLLFVPFDHFLEVEEKDYVIERDVKGRFFGTAPRAFSNACGFMSPGLSTKARCQLGVNYPEPSVLQVSYQGFQGVLVLKEVFTSVPQVQFRKSMQKFSTPKKMREAIPFIGIVDHSTPYIKGYLDSRLIMFLATRGVSTDYLKTLQLGYLNLLKNMCDKSASGEYFCHLIGRHAPTDRDVLASWRQDEVEKMIEYVYDHGADSDEPQRRRVIRTRILVPKSSVVFGVCDPYNKLKSGECYFKPTQQDDEEFEVVVVAPYPCYHPGDIQVLKLTQENHEYENLKDCLVLPLNQRLQHAFEYSGASKFFVSWDKDLVTEKRNAKPNRYLPTQSNRFEAFKCWLQRKFRVKTKREDREEMIRYFANFTNDLPRRFGDVYMQFAETHGPFSSKCEELSKMHYQAANLMANRDDLSKRLAKFEKSTPTRPTTSVDSPSSERSPLLGAEEEEEENEDVAHRKPHRILTRFLRFWRHKRVPPMPPVWKEFDQRSEKFVEEFYETNMNERRS